MEKTRLWAQIQRKLSIISVIVGVLGLSAAYPAGAQLTESLPSSPLPVKQEWKKMRASSFKATTESAYEQCLRTAAESVDDGLNQQKCILLREKLDQPELFPAVEQCRWIVVPDGVVFNFMNGIINGHSGVTQLVKKQLGREDKAQLCPLGDDWYGYFFRGDMGKSCNNMGFVHVPPPVVVIPPPPPPPPAPPAPTGKWVCRDVQFKDPVRSGTYQHLDGFQLENCCCGNDKFIPSHNFYIGDDLKSSGHTEKCDWVQF